VLESAGPWPFSDWKFYGEALIVSLVVFVGVSVIGLALVGTLPRLLNRAIKPGEVYPLYGYHYWIHRSITRLTNVPFFMNLFGDTSYVLHYLSWVGYDVSFDEQTGANFGLNVQHDNPYNVSVGAGTMAADGLSIVNTDYSNTSFRVSPVTIGAHSFLGNNIAYPARGKTGENCLHATKVMVPIEGEVRENVGFLGSPSFEIPRMVLRDRKFDEIKEGDEFRRRLAAKNRHNLATMGLYLLVRWVPVLVAVLLIWSAVILDQRLGIWMTVVPLLVAPVVAVGYFVLVERASTGFRRFRPLYCSMYDLESWRVERYWKLSWQPTLLNGTPLKSIAWRLLGVRIGKRVFDDGCLMIDKTMIAVGDHCTFNAGSVIQPHSQEDGTFKSDRVTIGDGCTLGPGALVHYGVTMGAGSDLAIDSFLMKGAVVAPDSRWGDNPAREIGDDDRAKAALPASATLPPEALVAERSKEVRSHEIANAG
jgi:non-ribosomal peptide synthetase-like protein